MCVDSPVNHKLGGSSYRKVPDTANRYEASHVDALLSNDAAELLYGNKSGKVQRDNAKKVSALHMNTKTLSLPLEEEMTVTCHKAMLWPLWWAKI